MQDRKSRKKAVSSKKIVDYAYALSIYEEYKQQYNLEEQLEESSLQNTQEAEAVELDEDVVKARWGQKDHVTLMENTLNKKNDDGSLMYKELNEECRKALLTGAVLPDNKFKAEGGYFFHGGKHNFLAYYKFLCQLAKRIKNRSDDHTAVRNIMKNLSEYYPKRSDGSAFPAAEKDSVTGTTLGQFDMLAKALNNVYTEWNSYVRYKENVTDKNDTGEQVKKTDLAMSYVIIGMAIHSATDTYAHRAGIKKDGEWVAVKTNDEDHDKLEQGGARAKAAQITCNRTLKRFHGTEKDCVAPFLIEGLDGYGGNGAGAFRLRNYQRCADEITDNYKNKLGKYSYTK